MNRSSLACLLTLLPSAALAFTGANHSSISKRALSNAKYDDGAAAEVVAGNLATDQDEFWDTQAHFDNENLAAGSKRLNKKLIAALRALDDCKPAEARAQLGRALHAVQDFFAHSNWVENHDAGDEVDLLRLADPGPDVKCDPKTHKGALTTGYYFDDREHPDKPTPAPAGKCLHSDLNKDDDSRPSFSAARDRALAETNAILARFDAVVIRKYSRVSSIEASYRLRLLKDTSDEFAAARDRCLPNPDSNERRVKDLLKVDPPFLRPY